MFRDYYAALYNLYSASSPAEVALKQSHIATYLSSVGFASLSPDQKAELELPITTVKLLTIVRSLPTGKSPVPDGFTRAYYPKFFDKLQAPFCTFLNSLATTGHLPQEASLPPYFPAQHGPQDIL